MSAYDDDFESIWESGAEEAARRDWADDRIADDEDADVSEAAYVTYLEGFFPDD